MGELRDKIVKYISEYLSTKIIFALDVCLSLLASLCAVLGVGYFSDSPLGGTFVLTWLGFSLLFSVLLFLSTKCYKIIIRHSTLKDMMVFLGIALAKALLLAMMMLFGK